MGSGKVVRYSFQDNRVPDHMNKFDHSNRGSIVDMYNNRT